MPSQVEMSLETALETVPLNDMANRLAGRTNQNFAAGEPELF